MTVIDVLLNFRQALLSTLPAVEKVGVPWRRPDSYDEWDAVATALYNGLVIEVIRYSLRHELQQLFSMPQYDLLLESYAGLCVVEVSHPALQPGRYVFHAFGTSETPFDIVELRRVSDAGDPCESDLTSCPVEKVRFWVKLDQSLNDENMIEEVTIE